MYTVTRPVKTNLPESFTIYAELIRPAQPPTCFQGMESLVIEVTFPNNGQMICPRLNAVVAEQFPDWQFVTWWMPEPDEF
ncbi:hypothetical protein DO97_16215 [Neosynechococcus sphagnicola sy1]|uniref:Uncharacterized protein n=1 Tax=Neosynechococcus sphagnicola sy1 TaxID=1497020 RepID=A0A098TIA6_9CYAN|nr:hypothetical protein [Neosynechococcus sphagnicola]KGF71712.1 hypothetical protein DO97_16215 [Neosynechococcus sphagnicola sy1]